MPHRPTDCHKPGPSRRCAPSQWLPPQEPKALLEGFCPEPRQEEQIALNSNGLILFLRLADVEWVEAVEQGVELHVGQKTHLLRASLPAVAAKLPPDRFLRINPSTLVNIEQIMGLQPAPHGGYDVLLRSGTRLTRNSNAETLGTPSSDAKPDAAQKPPLRKPKLSRWDR